MRKILMLLTVIVVMLVISCEKKEVKTNECNGPVFSYQELLKQIDAEKISGTYTGKKSIAEYAKEQDSKGKITPNYIDPDKGLAYRFVVCANWGCSHYGVAYFVVSCGTCSYAIGQAGCCPYCGVAGLCSNDGPCLE